MGRCPPTGVDTSISDLDIIVFGLSSDQDRLEKLGDGQDGKRNNLREKKDVCPSLLTLSLLANGLVLLPNLEATPLELVSGIHKVPFCGCYLPSSIVRVLIYVEDYLSLAYA